MMIHQIATLLALCTSSASGATASDALEHCFEKPLRTLQSPYGEFMVIDLDGDAFPDIVTINNDDSLSMYRGQADGTYALTHTTVIGEDMRGLSAADFNGDGHLDLVAVSHEEGIAAILSNQGDGTFDAPVTYPVGDDPVDTAIIDLGGDALPDLVVSLEYELLLCIRHGQVNGTLGTAQFLPHARSFPRDLEIGDVDGDGHDDITELSSSGMTIWLGDGAGWIDGIATQALAPSITNLALGDLDDDGAAEFVGVDFDGLIHILDADSSLQFEIVSTIEGGQIDIELADLNADGHLDLVTLAPGGGSLQVRHGTGDGTFGPAIDAGWLVKGHEIELADVTGDGRSDVLLRESGVGPRITIHPATIDGTFHGRRGIRTAEKPDYLQVSDADQDGVLDLIVYSRETKSLWLHRGLKGGALDEGSQMTSPPFNGPEFAVADFNADGFPDVAGRMYDAPGLGVGLNDGTGHVPSVVVIATDIMIRDLVAHDFNDDGNVDLCLLSSTEPRLTVFTGNGDGTFADHSVISSGGLAWNLEITEINGDGIADLMTLGESGQSLVTHLGQGDATFQMPTLTPLGFTSYSHAAADVNQDGTLDAVVLNSDDSTLHLLLGAGDGSFAAHETIAIPGHFQRHVAFLDVQNDGIPELVVANHGWNELHVFTISEGSPSLVLLNTLFPGDAPAHVTAADVDANGTIDLLVANRDSHTISIMHNDCVTCPADLTADGTVDFGDLIALLGNWGPCASCPADLDHDGDVSFLDLTALLAQWGPCGG